MPHSNSPYPPLRPQPVVALLALASIVSVSIPSIYRLVGDVPFRKVDPNSRLSERRTGARRYIWPASPRTRERKTLSACCRAGGISPTPMARHLFPISINHNTDWPELEESNLAKTYDPMRTDRWFAKLHEHGERGPNHGRGRRKAETWRRGSGRFVQLR